MRPSLKYVKPQNYGNRFRVLVQNPRLAAHDLASLRGGDIMPEFKIFLRGPIKTLGPDARKPR